MPQCQRCQAPLNEELVVRYNTEPYHRKCVEEQVKKELSMLGDQKLQQIMERIKGAKEIQVTERRGVEVFK